MGNNKRMQREQRMDKALRSMIQGFERVLNVYNVLDKKGEEKFKIDGREYLSMPEYIIKNSAGIDNDSRCAGAKRLHLKMVDDIPPGCFVFRPDKNSVAYRIGDEAERELTGHDKEVMQEVFGYLYKEQDVDKIPYDWRNDEAYREQRLDKLLSGRVHGFEEALNAYKSGTGHFKVNAREYGSMPEYFGRHVASFGDDPRCVGSKRLDLAPCGKEQDHFMLRQGGSSIVYVLGDEAERELTGHDKAVMREVFGYLARKQNKEITVAQDRGQFGTVREQDRSQSGASMFGTTVVRMKTPEDVEKLCQHGLYPQLVAAANDKNDDHNLMVVFQHRSATQAEREQFIGQLKKICPEVMTTTPSDVVPVAGTVKAIGKLPGKFSVVLMTNSEINLDKVIGHGRAYQASDLER